MDTDRYLSHRLRGFDVADYTEKSFLEGFSSRALYLEIDTRVSKDGALFVHHDPSFIAQDGKRVTICETDSASLSRLPRQTGEVLITLDRVLSMFAEREFQKQKLLIDVKDYGYEQEHVTLVRKYGVEKSIIWVSWVPYCLTRLHELDPLSPKLLSYVPVSHLVSSLVQLLPVIRMPFSDRVLLSDSTLDFSEEHPPLLGKHYMYLTDSLADEIREVLTGSGGGVCVSKQRATPAFIDEAKQQGFKVYVFSAEDEAEFDALLQRGADIVFCDFVPDEIR